MGVHADSHAGRVPALHGPHSQRSRRTRAVRRDPDRQPRGSTPGRGGSAIRTHHATCASTLRHGRALRRSGSGASPRCADRQLTWGVHVSLAPTWFDPAGMSGIITPYMVYYALHDPLLRPMPGLPFAPSLAESWSLSDHGLICQFILRKNAKFHNGEPVATGGTYVYGSHPHIDALFQQQTSELEAKMREATLHKIQQIACERSIYAHLWQLAFLNGAGPRVGESGLGLNTGHAYSAPYEDVTLSTSDCGPPMKCTASCSGACGHVASPSVTEAGTFPHLCRRGAA